MGASGSLRKQINKRNAPPPGGAIGTVTDMADPEKSGNERTCTLHYAYKEDG